MGSIGICSATLIRMNQHNFRDHSENITRGWRLLKGGTQILPFVEGGCPDFANLLREGIQILANINYPKK